MKICVIYASAGAGHRIAAQALAEAFDSRPGMQAVCIDALDYTYPPFARMYNGGYSFVVSRMSWAWAFFFRLLDLPLMFPVMQVMRRVQNGLFAAPLHRYLLEEDFDLVCTTHFLGNEVASYLKRKKRIRSKLCTVVTDYDVHRIWLSKGVDLYACACDRTHEKLLSLGVAEENIAATGIPVFRKFREPKDVPGLKRKMALDEEAFTVLVATGSFGMGPIQTIIKLLPGFQVLVVCGHNKELFERLSRKQKDLVKIFGLVNNMEELMAVSDVMITKPGGLSISEALVSGLPMVFFSAIPGQESNNIKVLKSYGIGISDCPVEDMARTLNRYRLQKKDLEDARRRIEAIARPNAAEDIINRFV